MELGPTSYHISFWKLFRDPFPAGHFQDTYDYRTHIGVGFTFRVDP
jgi:hypothetical protein